MLSWRKSWRLRKKKEVPSRANSKIKVQQTQQKRKSFAAYMFHVAKGLQKHHLKGKERRRMDKRSVHQLTPVQRKDVSQQRNRVRLIAAGPLGCQGRRTAGTTWGSPGECQPCCYWWSVPPRFQTASCHQNAPFCCFRFSRFWSECVHWQVCPWDPTPAESQSWTQGTWAAGMFLRWAASSSCPSVRGWGIPVCTSLLPPLGHEVQGGHLEKQKKKQKKSFGWQISKETFAFPWWKLKVTEFPTCSSSTCHKWLNISTGPPDDLSLSTAACFTPGSPTNISNSWCGGLASQRIPDGPDRPTQWKIDDPRFQELESRGGRLVGLWTEEYRKGWMGSLQV